MPHVELAVLGAGSGNTVPGRAWKGRDVALFDDGEWFGGTCLNAGCIPTKMFVRVADIVLEAQHQGLGLDGSVPHPDWHAVQDRILGRTNDISLSGEAWRDKTTRLVRETSALTGDRTIVTASGEEFTADRLVLAAGSRPRPLGCDHDPRDILTSDSVMRVDELPSSMLIIGSGAVAVEFAHVFASFGTQVTIAARGPRLLRAYDELIGERFTELADARYRVLTNVSPLAVERDGEVLRTTFDNGDSVNTEVVLNASGRIPNTDRIAADRFDTDRANLLVTDDRMRVLRDGEPVDGVYALGDITSGFGLKHVANHQARIVEAQLAGRDERDTLVPVPGAVFAGPEVAHFGIHAADAPNDAVVVTQDYGSTAYGWALEDRTSFVRLIVGRDGTLLGAHILGPQASILLQPLVQAASYGRTVHGLARGQYWPHPALTEVVENALLQAEDALAAGGAA
ncbi:MAG TPA: FAD-dependent oxidoreductase [Candidatus Agrococcus pullicola]|uniref:FAD-dependent oxidoreductase n=1 Tax=Candidatus Agrococcus pullicola TaxID=2838429 RepID=A0A9D1YY14_9MICO|nr:FAD-dependent oxidoreductase [Candidatus Agrococcus pullicola]